MALRRELVHRRAVDLELSREILGRDAHVVAVERVGQEQRDPILEGGVAEARAEAVRARVVRQPAHVLGAAGDDDLRVAGLDEPRRSVDRLEAAATEAVERERGRLDRYPRLDRGVSRDVGVLRDLPDAAHQDVIDLVGLDPRALDRGFDRNRAKFSRRLVLEPSPEAPDGSARSGDNHYLVHVALPFLRWSA